MAGLTETAEPTAGTRHRSFWDRAASIAVENPFLFVLTALIAIALALLSPALFVGDSWMTLVAGREVAENGIPDRETMTVLASGERWIDQQWLAQLALYGVERTTGLAGVALFNVALVTSAFGSAMIAARLLGASARSTFIVTFVCLFVAPWSWQIRAQAFALPLFVWTLWLAADHVRHPSRRLLLALPILAIWGNIHGSVVLGAALVSGAALWTAAKQARSRSAWIEAVAVAGAAPVCALATPYGLSIIDYYHLLLIDPPFGDALLEWERTTFRGLTVLFFVIAAATVVLAIWKRSCLTWFELFALAGLFVLALDAIRGIAWFALAVAVLLPRALKGVFRKPERIQYPRVNLAVSALSIAAVALVFAILAARSASWFEGRWPSEALAAVESAGPQARVFPSDRHADWLLWHLPGLRGRIAYDIRFELLDKATFRQLQYWTTQYGREWASVAKGYDAVIVDESDPDLLDRLLAQAGSRAKYRDDQIAVVVRSSPAD